MVASFKDKLANIDGITDKAAADYVAQATQIVEQKLYPEFKNVSAIMHALESKAPENVGIWAQPNGEAFYQHEITYLADSDMSAEEIHQIGLAEVERISKRMDEILKQNGYSQGTVLRLCRFLHERELIQWF